MNETFYYVEVGGSYRGGVYFPFETFELAMLWVNNYIKDNKLEFVSIEETTISTIISVKETNLYFETFTILKRESNELCCWSYIE